MFCQNESSNNTRTDAYKSYVETISPNSYDAYEKCLQATSGGLIFDINSAAVLPKHMGVIVTYKTSFGASSVQIGFSNSPDVTCKWDLTESSVVQLSANGSAHLTCDRSVDNKISSITLYPQDSSAKAIVFPWRAYDEQGVPIDTIQYLNHQVELFTNSIKSAVVGFASEQCPDGWKPYEEAYGRFLRGIDPTGSKEEDPDGIRKPRSKQEDAFRSHDHAIDADSPNNPSRGMWAPGYGSRAGAISATYKRGGEETRPKNVAVLFCVKQ